MAFDHSKRFSSDPTPYPIFEPAGVYQTMNSARVNPNKVPFLTKTPRNTGEVPTIWTHAFYNADMLRKIPNCTSISSKVPRFPYELLSKEDIETMLCNCGLNDFTECLSEEGLKTKIDELICQGKVPRRIFKGCSLRSVVGDGQLSLFKRDKGYKVSANGSTTRVIKQVRDEVPFYDTNITEHNAFYHGWKWSTWTSQRTSKPYVSTPGPAQYQTTTEDTHERQYNEKVKAFKRKTSKQLRFIEMVQRKNILENLPGPADHRPQSPKGTATLFPKAPRFFSSNFNVIPDPTSYYVKRDFEVDKEQYFCHATLPIPPAFSVKSNRFKYPTDTGPSPASYSVNYEPCQYSNSNLSPFGSTTKRFKEKVDENNESDIDNDEPFTFETKETQEDENKLKYLSWMFKSDTLRMKKIKKRTDEPSPADLPQSKGTKQVRHVKSFLSTEERFKNWFNWIPVHGAQDTPGPGYYNFKKPEKRVAVHCGPMFRSQRFISNSDQTPAPNEYKIENGIETVLMTHNKRLKDNINNTRQVCLNPPVKVKILGYEEKEALLLNKCISLLDTPYIFSTAQEKSKVSAHQPKRQDGTKLLRCFAKNK